MNRRHFARNIATALGATALGGNTVSARRRSLAARPAVTGRPGAEEGEAPGVPFKLSVMLWTVFNKLPFEERLEKVAEAGYHNVELVGEYKGWSEDKFQNAVKKKRELGLTFDVTAGLGHGVADPKAREAFLSDLKAELPIMEKIECNAIIVMSGNRVPGLAHEQMHQSCVEGLKRAAELVEGKNVRLLLENIDPEENPKYFLTSVAEGFEIVREVNQPHVQFLCDFFHEQIAEGNLIEKLKKNIDLVGLVHIADVPGRHEPGTGEINYANIFKTLGELNYRHYAAMEYLPTYDAVTSLRTEREKALKAGRV
ncbi:MAG: hydroxypyruvate isomerase [Acidobacteria bacterium]|nr:MAG: hydroxypyruvate isomerase [Acidobacteriota bacterium]